MMSETLQAEYSKGLRALLEAKGTPVQIDTRERELYPGSPDLWVSVYGWEDDVVRRHGKTCGWVLPLEVEISEVSYSEFQDTYSENSSTVGINGEGTDEPIRCTCGKYSNVTLRVEVSLGEALQSILGMNSTSMIV